MAEDTTVADTTAQTPSIDVDAIKASILSDMEAKKSELLDSVSQQTKKEIVDKLVGDADKGKKWVPKDYEEIVDKSVNKFQEVLDKREKDYNDRVKVQGEQQQKTQAEWNKYWDAQILDLETEGFLPPLPEDIVKKLADNKPLTKDEQDDPAVQARATLYAKSKELRDSGFRDYGNLELVYHKYIAREGNSMIGAEAPVSRQSRGFTPPTGKGYSFEEVRGNSIHKIASGKK